MKFSDTFPPEVGPVLWGRLCPACLIDGHFAELNKSVIFIGIDTLVPGYSGAFFWFRVVAAGSGDSIGGDGGRQGERRILYICIIYTIIHILRSEVEGAASCGRLLGGGQGSEDRERGAGSREHGAGAGSTERGAGSEGARSGERGGKEGRGKGVGGQRSGAGGHLDGSRCGQGGRRFFEVICTYLAGVWDGMVCIDTFQR